jgi:hypothetical protein
MASRRDVEGTLARWFAIDADSHIAVFTGPYAAWPAAVFEDYASVDAASEFLAFAPPSSDGVLSDRWRASGASPTMPMEEASHGLYSFDADPGYGGQTIYFLDASPTRPLLERDAPPIVRRAARLVCFSSIRFADVSEIDLAAFVPFVVGNG